MSSYSCNCTKCPANYSVEGWGDEEYHCCVLADAPAGVVDQYVAPNEINKCRFANSKLTQFVGKSPFGGKRLDTSKKVVGLAIMEEQCRIYHQDWIATVK